MTLPEYLSALAKLHASGRATEHSYRGDLQQLLSSLCTGITVTNEPQRIACGAPDYILTKKDIPVGYIEAKDIGVDMDSKSLKDRVGRQLTFDDIRHFQRMIVALTETGKVMEEVDKVGVV